MKYFQNCKTLDEAKNLFRKLVFELHPDRNNGIDKGVGSVITEFKIVSKTLKFNTGFDADKNFDADKFASIIAKFQHLEDLTVSFVGSWIWITGDTQAQKENIKAINLEGYNPARWARKKLAWQFSPEGIKKGFRGKKTLEQIKATYGSKSYTMKGSTRIA